MATPGIITLLLILIIVTVSYRGMIHLKLYQTYQLNTERLLVHKEYYRLFTSGFLHVGWWHLALNMIALYGFGRLVEMEAGIFGLLLIFIIGLLTGNLMGLYLNRRNKDYSQVGTSCAVNAILFAGITMVPDRGFSMMFLPFQMPGWLFGLIFMFLTLYTLKSERSEIGQAAHAGAGMVGVLLGIIFYPPVLQQNVVSILLLLIPAAIVFLISILRPTWLGTDRFFFKREKKYFSVDDQYREERKDKQLELDELLEKISRKGMNSLSRKERQRLEELSK